MNMSVWSVCMVITFLMFRRHQKILLDNVYATQNAVAPSFAVTQDSYKESNCVFWAEEIVS